MSMFGGNMALPSLADIAAVTGNRNGGYGGFGDGNGAWLVIILLALLGGFGNGGYGNNRGAAQEAYDTQSAVQRGFDTQTVVSKLDGISNGICNLGYDQLAQMNGISNTVMQTGFGLQRGIDQLGVSNMRDAFGLQQAINADTVAGAQNTATLSRQLADCCCENRAAIADIKYQMATDTCALNTNIHQTGDAIINSQTAGFNMLNQTINDRFTRLEMNQKDQYIRDLERKLSVCDRDSALQGMATYVVNQVRPTPIPSWNVQNPWAGCNCNTGCDFNNNCSRCC